MSILIEKKKRPLKAKELTTYERNGAELIAVNTIVEMEYGECSMPEMPAHRVRYWVYHFREGMAR
jgi:hypothetical protein